MMPSSPSCLRRQASIQAGGMLRFSELHHFSVCQLGWIPAFAGMTEMGGVS